MTSRRLQTLGKPKACTGGGGDCNDGDAAVKPTADEICDDVDNCPGVANADQADADNDTYTLATATRFCDIVTGYRAAASTGVDCNDTNAAINPGATEICDALNTDENCNGTADNAERTAAMG